MEIDLKQIASAINGKIICQYTSADCIIGGVRIDSREICKSDIFFGIKGENVDGNQYLSTAIKNGASIVVCDKNPTADDIKIAKEFNASIIYVDDSQLAIQNLASFWRSQINATVLAITGSVGKTTSKKLCNDVLNAKFNTTCNKGNFNNELGLPMTICDSNIDHQFLITEMGMNGKGEIGQLCEIANPDWGLITNIGIAHIEYLGSQDNIAKEKSTLAKYLPENDGVMFINIDEKYRDFIIDYAQLNERNVEIVFYGGTSQNCKFENMQIWYECPSNNPDGTWVFDMCVYDGTNIKKQRCNLKLKGKHNIINACGACAVGFKAGIELSAIINALEDSDTEHGRQEMLKSSKGYYVINDAYNANPSSMIASIETFDSIEISGKKIAFLGDMFELGDYSRQGHLDVGINVAKFNIDFLICVGVMSQNIAKAAIDGGMNKHNVYTFDNLDDAKCKLLDILNPQDAVLFKASNGMKFSKLALELID